MITKAATLLKLIERSMAKQARISKAHMTYLSDKDGALRPYTHQTFRAHGGDEEREQIIHNISSADRKHKHVSKYLDKISANDADFDKVIDSYRGKTKDEIHADLHKKGKHYHKDKNNV